MEKIELQKVLLKLTILAGIFGLLIYLAFYRLHSIKPIVKSTAAYNLPVLDCSTNASSTKVAISNSEIQPPKCLFTSCSGFYQ